MLYDLKIFQKVYDFLLWLKPTVQRFTKAHKYSLGLELEKEAIELLKNIVKANLSRTNKKTSIEECLVHYELVRIFIRLAKDYKLLSLRQYEFASEKLSEIGKMLGGWYKRFL